MFRNQSGTRSLLVSRDGALGHQFTFLFSVVLHHRFEWRDSPAALPAEQGGALDLVFVHLPDDCDEGLAVLDHFKAFTRKPKLIVIRSPENSFGLSAFLGGADDVVEWPCPMHELAGRVSVRLGQCIESSGDLAESLNWDTEAYIVDRAGLTIAEAQILRILFSSQGKIVSRNDLSEAIDQRPWSYGDRKFDVHVAKIRKKIEAAFGPRLSVTTVRSSGYILSTEPSLKSSDH